MEPARFRVNSPTVVSETVDGEVIMIHLDTGNYYSLRSTGSLIWDAIERGASVDAITRALDATAHNGTDTNAGVASFVEELRAEDLIVPADSASAPGSGDTVERVPEEELEEVATYPGAAAFPRFKP